MIPSSKRGAVALCAAVALLSLSRTSRADDEAVLGSRSHSQGSAQTFALEVRVGPYSPRVDDDPALKGKTPFADEFGSSEPQVEVGFELDWEVLRIPFLGTLGPGVGIGYTTVSGGTHFISGKYAGQASGESTSLDIYPMYAVAVLRIDTLLRELRVPLVPYLKGGLGYALWVASQGGATSVSNTTGVSGRGHTVGTQLAAGLSLALDALDPHAARELDESTGINHTYIFAEYMLSDLNGLGQSSALLVGTHSPEFGLAVEF